MTCLVIAEAGVNHNGSLQQALKLVEVAAAAGADAVKFQSFRAEALVAPGTATADYQQARTGDTDQFAMLQELQLSPDDHAAIVRHCADSGVEFMSTAFDAESADLLLQLGVKRFKIPSGELTNHPLLAHFAATGLPLIMSTGMATLDEVGEAIAEVDRCRAQSGLTQPLRQTLTVLHCTSNYPAPMDGINLRAMVAMQRAFELPVGYSDHTAGILVPPAAVAMGATVIEKHFTLDRSLPGPDHAASLEPDELRQMVRDIRSIEGALGDGVKAPTAAELPVRDLVRRSVILARAVAAGTPLAQNDLVLLRPGTGIAPNQLQQVLGSRPLRDLPQGHVLRWSDLGK